MKPDKTSTTPLYIQIREDFRVLIANGTLKTGERLPSVTALAKEKGVTAATIRRALQDLIDEGLIDSHVGRGTFVTDPATARQPDATTAPATKGASRMRTNEATAAARRLRQSVSRSLSEMINLAHRPGVIAFTRGIGDPGSIEKGILNRLAQKALASGEEMFWDYGDPRGLESLRSAIANLYREQGLEISPAQILITSGSQQAIALIAQQASENGTTVICETPCYAGVTNAFSAFNLPIETIVRGADGPDVSQIPAQTDPVNSIFYLCPVLHNPTGTDISVKRQKEIAAWARMNNAIILADEVFRDLHVDGTPPVSFLKEPGPERAIILGSLSKSFISGLRVGWIVTSEERIKALTQIKKTMDLGCPPLMQGIAQAFLEDKDGYDAHRDRTRAHYRELRDVTLVALGKNMPDGVSWTKPNGGFQLWVTLPKGFSSVELFLRSVEKGAAFLPGPLQDINNRFMNSFRLCYGSLREDEIKEGIRRLAEAVREYLAETPGDAGMAGLGDF
jgi:DNA-binding transcriptional MocR family regulator